ncbi:MAG: hypothetical protein CMD36_08155 [Flavobacteriales bacterium]|nr:hypothetical protein [Flavobacteriales bacterium]
MNIIILHFLLFLFLIYSNGKIYFKYIHNNNINLNFFETSLFGLIITGFIAQIFNFIIPLNNYILYLNILICLLFLFNNFNYYKLEIKKIEFFFYLFVFIFTVILIYGSPFSDDLNHYHASYISNIDNSKLIIGSNFLHHHYGLSSIWLILHSYLNFNTSLLQDIHVLNGIIFFLVLCVLFKKILFNSNLKNKLNFTPIFTFLIFFLILKYSRLKEFGIDRPGFLIIIFTIYYFLNNFFYKKNIQIFHFINLFILTFFLFSIKIIFLPFLILSLIYFIYEIKLKLLFTSKEILIILIFGLSFALKNILISGCLIYPIEITCIEVLQWNSKEIASNLSFGAEVVNKSYNTYQGNLSPIVYIKNMNWIENWYLTNYKQLLDYILVLLVSCFFTFIIFKKNKSAKYDKKIIILSLILLMLSLFIASKTPVIRMFHHVFYLIGIILITFFLNFSSINLKKNYFIILLIICFSFTLNKNVNRIIKSNYKNDPISHIKEINWYQTPKKRNLDGFIYYDGWIDASPLGNENLDKLNYTKKFTFDIIYKK